MNTFFYSSILFLLTITSSNAIRDVRRHERLNVVDVGSKLSTTTNEIEDAFDAWSVKFEKEFPSKAEKLERLKIFSENFVFVLEHNAKYVLGKASHYVE